MDQDFAEVIRLMVNEQGVEVLVNGKAKTFLSDYCKSQFKKEANVFRQILEAGCGEHINNADNVLERKRKLMEQLEENDGLSPKVTADYLDLLGLLLKGDTSKCSVTVAPTQTRRSTSKSAPKHTKPRKSAPLASPAPNAVPDGFVWIPGGTFMMGSPESELGRRDNEGPQHQVTVSGFYMGKYQVTQAQYKAVTGRSSPYCIRFVGGGEVTFGEGPSVEFPVIFVEWDNAIKYCNERSLKEGLTPAYTIKDKNETDSSYENVTVKWNKKANGYRLPTEAEWEYACRAGTTSAYNTGDTISNNTGWYKDNSGDKTHQVGLKPANAWGLYDMHGNVFEWCWDLYGDYPNGAQTDPTGASSGDSRILRGGFYGSNGVDLRSAYRNCYYAGLDNRLRFGPSKHFGFRLVRS